MRKKQTNYSKYPNKGDTRKTFKGKSKPAVSSEDENKPYIGPNDIGWRTNDATMTQLVATLPFGHPAGLPWRVFNTVGGSIFTVQQPGILSITTLLTGGNCTDYNSPFNLAVRKIYSYVRHANSGSRNYDAVDMGMYFLAVGQLLGLLGYCQRVLRVLSEFSATNRYTPTALLRSMSIDPSSFLGNMAQFKYLVAWLGRAVGSLSFPDLPYFHACYEAFKYIYKDNDSPKEQFYVITPTNIGKYDPTYDSNGGGITFSATYNIPLPNQSVVMSYNNLYDLVRERVDVLMGDEDIGIIAGDILKAFPNGAGLFKPVAFGTDYDLVQHSPEILQQVHNLTVLRPAVCNLKGYKQNPGGTNLAPYAEHDFVAGSVTFTSARGVMDHFVIDAFSRVPDAKEVVNCSVLNPQYQLALSGTTYIVDTANIYFDLYLPTGVYLQDDVTGNPTGNSSRFDKVFESSGTTLMSANTLITNFDWHPLIFMYGPSDNRGYVVGDIQNFNVFDIDVGIRIHENSMLNLLAFKEHNFY